jgi:hypothetical protein
MLTTLADVPAGQQLILKLQGAAVMGLFGAIAGVILRWVLRGIEDEAFVRSTPSRKSPWR